MRRRLLTANGLVLVTAVAIAVFAAHLTGSPDAVGAQPAAPADAASGSAPVPSTTA